MTAIFGAVFVGLAKIFNVTDPIIAVNFMSVFFSALCVPFFYFSVYKLFDKKTALISSIIFSIKPSFLAISVFGNSHSPFLFFMFLGFYFLFSYTDKNKTKNFFISALFFGLMGAARLQDLVPLLLPILFWVIIKTKEYNQEQWIKNSSVFVMILITTILLFYIKLLIHIKPAPSGYIFSDYFVSHIFETIKHTHLDRFPIMIELFLFSQTLVGLIAVIAGGILLFQKSKKMFLFLMLWAFIPFAIYTCLAYARPRSFIVPSVALIIMQGYFLANFFKEKKMLNLLAIGLLLVSVSLNFSRIVPILDFRHKNEMLPDFYRWIGHNTEKNAVILERDNSAFIRYYGKRTPMRPPADMFKLEPQKLKTFEKKLNALLDQGIPVYTTESGIIAHAPKTVATLKKFFNQNYDLVYVGKKKFEDWHLGCLVHHIASNRIFKIKKKAN